MKGAVLFGSWSFWVKWEWPRALYPFLIFDGREDVVDRDLKRREILFFSADFCLVPRGLLIDVAGSPILPLLGGAGCDFSFFPHRPS